jgi:hypothetical protein
MPVSSNVEPLEVAPKDQVCSYSRLGNQAPTKYWACMAPKASPCQANSQANVPADRQMNCRLARHGFHEQGRHQNGAAVAPGCRRIDQCLATCSAESALLIHDSCWHDRVSMCVQSHRSRLIIWGKHPGGVGRGNNEEPTNRVLSTWEITLAFAMHFLGRHGKRAGPRTCKTCFCL